MPQVPSITESPVTDGCWVHRSCRDLEPPAAILPRVLNGPSVFIWVRDPFLAGSELMSEM